MTRKPTPANALDEAPGLRKRIRADGTLRWWWEPTAAQRRTGCVNVELDATKPGLAVRRARELSRAAQKKTHATPDAVTVRAGSVAALILDYRQSLKFSQLAATTQAAYDVNLRVIEAKWGPQPLAKIDGAMMDLWYEALYRAKGTFRARAILSAMSVIMRHAERRRLRPRGTNPCRDLDMEKPKGRSRVGTWDELNACLAAARQLSRQGDAAARHIRCALMLVIFGGQRQLDIHRAKPAAFSLQLFPQPGNTAPRKLWIWSLTRSKRNNAGHIPIASHAVPVLRAQLRLAATGPGPLIWDATTGLPFTKESFYRRWSAVRSLAAVTCPSVTSLQWRDLRRTFGHLARMGGAGKDDVADVLGNTADVNPELAVVYMAPQLATTLRAVDAVTRPGPKEKTQPERKKA
ncbi:MAG: hypothetical protein V4712_15090 [Pseudomonadota bacterium]